ncbi:MAG: hypothetical protein HC765_16040 [Brachymonas sp.]|nr:hypothetical protein [Brachymonas sp.]
MNIEMIIASMSHQIADGVLIAKSPFTWGSEAKIVELTEDFKVPQKYLDEGYEYLLGQDDIVKLLEFLKTKKISNKAKAEFVVHYAVNDAFPSWIEDISNV